MKLEAMVIHPDDFRIRPAERSRQWMDDTNQQFAYRCLPLIMANSHGWEILAPHDVVAHWNGKEHLDAITVKQGHCALSHFGHGILTFHVSALFRTEPGYDLMVSGPINRPKDGIQGLTALIETDWSPYTFTMNWVFTRPGNIRFDEGEPICHIFPVPRGMLEKFEPTTTGLAGTPEEQDYLQWSETRNDFNRRLTEKDPETTRIGWQKLYYRGLMPCGRSTEAGHATRHRIKPFKERE